MALPATIETSMLRRVNVTRRDGTATTLYDVAEQVYSGAFRLAEQGAPAAHGTVTPEVEVDGRTVHVTVTVE